MEIRECIEFVAKQWPAYRQGKTTNKTAPVYEAIVHNFPSELSSFNGKDSAHLKVEGSTGRGNVSNAPWVATFDTRITQSARDGYYPVYLFSSDCDRVYLSLAVGATQFERQYGRKKSLSKIASAASVLRRFCTADDTDVIQEIDIAGPRGGWLLKAYEAGVILAFPAYHTRSLPEGKQLEQDYRRMLRLYEDLINVPSAPSVAELLEASIPLPTLVTVPVAMEFAKRPGKKERGKGSGGNSKRRSTESVKVGDAGERAVMAYEIDKLTKAGHKDLADNIKHDAALREYPGWDISSYDNDRRPIFIEVKSTVGNVINEIELTPNEWRAATCAESSESFHIYLVTNALSSNPRIEILRNPGELVGNKTLEITPSLWQLSLRG
ncbi:MrcB family domain-containing protein [Ahrensia marina]|uniref:Uncharacterized protein n=1 Tax=Ahrensia marina TaxID=1514904 RepID=A0A0N0E886_9HYPH|nr:DUF3578 domain-containing protein [Ahrensia marina]KPB02055.1 hypothetical protein SU32_04630 [Ahrensia marina]